MLVAIPIICAVVGYVLASVLFARGGSAGYVAGAVCFTLFSIVSILEAGTSG